MYTVASRSLLATGCILAALGCTGSIAGGGDSPDDPTTPGVKPPGGKTPGKPDPDPGKPPVNPDPGGSGGSPGMNPMGGLPPGTVPGDDYKGPRPLRRLTRSQYNNTVRDLLGINGDVAGAFGIDEQDSGFASNNQAPLTEVQVERYAQVAEELAEKAVANLDRVVPCAPPKSAEAACVDQFVRSLGKRAYRRPLTESEVSRMKQIFATGREGGDFGSGVSLVLTALLQSPHFLYLVETGDPAGATGDRLPLTQYETGTRLSYFLVNSTPDEELLTAAEGGKLANPTDIATQARRLLGTMRARDTMTSFFAQWLDIDDLLTVEKDTKAYPIYTPLVRAALRDDVLELSDSIVRTGDSRLATLMTAKYSFLRGPIYPIYGLPMQGNAGGSIVKRVDLPANERSGIFTLAGVMTKHGHADQSSPVGRGKLISERLLCVEPPPPPPGVDNNIPAVSNSVPTRLRFEMHRTKPECAACHALMDPLGVAFEVYDGVGHYRTMDAGKPVDSASTLTGSKSHDGPIKDAVDLMGKLAVDDEVRGCVARQMFRYAFGRGETAEDEPAIAEALAAFGKADYKITDLMVGIASSTAFRTRKAPDLK